MPTMTLEYHDDAERLLLEQALAYFAQVRRVAGDAPYGSVLAVAEQAALDGGRDLLRATLASTLQRSADAADAKKKRPAAGRRAAAPAG